MVTLRSVCFAHGSTPVLHNLSFSIAPNQLLAVLGPNGAGKTTLLNLLSGSTAPASGSLLLGDTPLHHRTSRELAQRRAVVPQSSSLAVPYRVLDLVLMGRMPHNNGKNTTHDEHIALQALATVQAQHLANRPYTALSGGEQQRVHIARALAQLHHPNSSLFRLLLLDEPTSHLDIGQSHRLLQCLRSLCSPTLAIVMVVHDVNLAARYADRVVLLHQGRIHAEGTSAEVLTPPSIARLYGVQADVWPHPLLGYPIVMPQ